MLKRKNSALNHLHSNAVRYCVWEFICLFIPFLPLLVLANSQPTIRVSSESNIRSLDRIASLSCHLRAREIFSCHIFKIVTCLLFIYFYRTYILIHVSHTPLPVVPPRVIYLCAFQCSFEPLPLACVSFFKR